eukprot:4413324-Pleurochrysis_carterae.AAC.1
MHATRTVRWRFLGADDAERSVRAYVRDARAQRGQCFVNHRIEIAQIGRARARPPAARRAHGRREVGPHLLPHCVSELVGGSANGTVLPRLAEPEQDVKVGFVTQRAPFDARRKYNAGEEGVRVGGRQGDGRDCRLVRRGVSGDVDRGGGAGSPSQGGSGGGHCGGEGCGGGGGEGVRRQSCANGGDSGGARAEREHELRVLPPGEVEHARMHSE